MGICTFERLIFACEHADCVPIDVGSERRSAVLMEQCDLTEECLFSLEQDSVMREDLTTDSGSEVLTSVLILFPVLIQTHSFSDS